MTFSTAEDLDGLTRYMIYFAARFGQPNKLKYPQLVQPDICIRLDQKCHIL